MKLKKHQRLKVVYIYVKFHENRFKGYLNIANYTGL